MLLPTSILAAWWFLNGNYPFAWVLKIQFDRKILCSTSKLLSRKMNIVSFSHEAIK